MKIERWKWSGIHESDRGTVSGGLFYHNFFFMPLKCKKIMKKVRKLNSEEII